MSIEIIVEHHVLLESMIQNWKSDDLSLSYYHDHLEQIRFSAYSPHIDVLSTKTSLDKRIISLNILLNGAIFITNTISEFDLYSSNLEFKIYIILIKKLLYCNI